MSAAQLNSSLMSAFRHDTPAKPRVVRVPKARTEPWVYTAKQRMSSVGATLTASVWFVALRFVALHSLRKCRPRWGLNKCVSMIKPRACALGYAGVSPLQGSPTSFQSVYFITLMRLPYAFTSIKPTTCF